MKFYKVTDFKSMSACTFTIFLFFLFFLTVFSLLPSFYLLYWLKYLVLWKYPFYSISFIFHKKVNIFQFFKIKIGNMMLNIKCWQTHTHTKTQWSNVELNFSLSHTRFSQSFPCSHYTLLLGFFK